MKQNLTYSSPSLLVSLDNVNRALSWSRLSRQSETALHTGHVLASLDNVNQGLGLVTYSPLDGVEHGLKYWSPSCLSRHCKVGPCGHVFTAPDSDGLITYSSL